MTSDEWKKKEEIYVNTINKFQSYFPHERFQERSDDWQFLQKHIKNPTKPLHTFTDVCDYILFLPSFRPAATLIRLAQIGLLL
jgi:hypothetical protein